ncbi:hypothetical protein RB614_29890 [Phytohabitans sp. ZYX-F-186]|uniref:Aryldialkylphosphatase n=1 Tax=Phytohabitans maris TaxID=3071409 RepID=A0ABU0ZPU0_9ACTN|nr:hypothetical protein [Phytohabitans sp. ZYX-F-186]MDQ7908751.1 hypothetical protein [Phytohabitans sp. ZYX-F-186]
MTEKTPNPGIVTAMTVSGPIEPTRLGLTLMHEHIYASTLVTNRMTGLLIDAELMTTEVARYRAAGGGTIVELSCGELAVGGSPDPTGRFHGVPDSGYSEHGTRPVNNVLALRALSEATGVHLVLGTGHYRQPYYDDNYFDRHTVDQIADRMVLDLTEGFPGTDVRAGIIGEIGADTWHLTAMEERSFRAAARASLRTGAAISTHACRFPVGIDQLDILEAEGVAPDRVVIGHCDTVFLPEYHLAIARRGAYVQFDNIRAGHEFDLNRRADWIVRLVREGHIDQICLSHDIVRNEHLSTYGGGGYTYLTDSFIPRLLAAGLTEDDVHRITISNPQRVLSIAA